jgi:hypothetical protein
VAHDAQQQPPVSDTGILASINDMVSDEHALRAQVASGEAAPEDAHRRLAAIEVELDRCWDLLRQRRARREFGQDEAGAEARPASEVESYRN